MSTVAPSCPICAAARDALSHLIPAESGMPGKCELCPIAGDDVHAVGSLAPLAPVVGCIVIRPEGTRVIARVERDPLAE